MILLLLSVPITLICAYVSYIAWRRDFKPQALIFAGASALFALMSLIIVVIVIFCGVTINNL